MWTMFASRPDRSSKEALFHDLFLEVEMTIPGARLSQNVRNRLEQLSTDDRRQIVNRVKHSCSPLFVACKRGQLDICDYLIKVCGADIELRGIYEVEEETTRTNHSVTPLWCAAVSGKIHVCRLLLDLGAKVDNPSDSGSTPLRSACFMTHSDIAKLLIKRGANVNQSNNNGGTCLINSVQSPTLCQLLLKNGANINARDVQNKTALHYAIQENRLETVKLLLKNGADATVRSRYGDDPLQMACLKGNESIFNYLIDRIECEPHRLAEAYELLGTTLLDEQQNLLGCLQAWTKSINYRRAHNLPERLTTDLIDMVNVEELQQKSLELVEYILGTHHKDTIYRLILRGTAEAELGHTDRCSELWRKALRLRIEKDTILSADTCFAAQALVKLLIDRHIQSDDTDAEMRFEETQDVFLLLFRSLLEAQPLLDIRPQHKRQHDTQDKIIRCITHLLFILVNTAVTKDQNHHLDLLVRNLVLSNLRCSHFGQAHSILHLCLNSFNTVRSSYFVDANAIPIFPNACVVMKLIKAGADVNFANTTGATPLHIAAINHNYNETIFKMLLDQGGHLDLPDAQGWTPLDAFVNRPLPPNVCVLNYISLKCLCAKVISMNRVQYRGMVPRTLETFIRRHL